MHQIDDAILSELSFLAELDNKKFCAINLKMYNVNI